KKETIITGTAGRPPIIAIGTITIISKNGVAASKKIIKYAVSISLFLLKHFPHFHPVNQILNHSKCYEKPNNKIRNDVMKHRNQHNPDRNSEIIKYIYFSCRLECHPLHPDRKSTRLNSSH